MGYRHIDTTQGQQDKFPVTDVFQHIEVAENRVWLLRSGIYCFAGDLTSEEKELVWATAMAPVADLFNQKVDGVAWRTKPRAYVVASQDRTVNPELERFSAERMGAPETPAWPPAAATPGRVSRSAQPGKR